MENSKELRTLIFIHLVLALVGYFIYTKALYPLGFHGAILSSGVIYIFVGVGFMNKSSRPTGIYVSSSSRLGNIGDKSGLENMINHEENALHEHKRTSKGALIDQLRGFNLGNFSVLAVGIILVIISFVWPA